MVEGSSLCTPILTIPESIKGTSSKVQVRTSSVHGYGVFANERIDKGELIEESKLLRLAWRSKYHHDPTLNNYVWANQACKCRECETHGYVRYIALGLGSLYNHSDEPNSIQKLDFAKEVMCVQAHREILPGEEIFVNYGHKYWLVRDFWAQVNKNKLLEKFHQEQIKPKLDRK
jgi:SET domain-containing protein